jgi:hypothetical protein
MYHLYINTCWSEITIILIILFQLHSISISYTVICVLYTCGKILLKTCIKNLSKVSKIPIAYITAKI